MGKHSSWVLTLRSGVWVQATKLWAEFSFACVPTPQRFTQVLATTSLALFWHVLGINLLAQEPMEMFMNFIHKTWTPVELENEGGSIARLTCGKAARIANEYNLLLDDAQLDDLVDSWTLTEHSSESDPDNHLMAFYLLQVASQSAHFNRRIVEPLQRCLVMHVGVYHISRHRM